MFENIRADFDRYYRTQGEGQGVFAALVAASQFGFLATLLYRYGRWTRTVRPRALRVPFRVVYFVLARVCDMLCGINISLNAEIGAGLYIGHYGGIFLHGDMGKNCSVGQCVTIGYKGAGKSTRAPRIGNDVYIGTSAVIVGDIVVGDGVVIGANTTVVKNVPAGFRVVSAPVRMLAPRHNSTPPSDID